MLVQDLQDRLVRRADVVINVRQAHMVDMLCERDPDILAEHAAEIVAVQAEFVRDLFQRELFHIVLIDVRYDLPDSELIPAGLREIFFEQGDGKISDQAVQDVQRDRVGRDHVPSGLPDIQRHELFEAIADLQISGDQFVCQFSTAADDLEVAFVIHQTLDQIIINAQHDPHISACATGFVDLVGIDYDEFARNEPMLRPFQVKSRVAVQNIDQLQGIMPVRRRVLPCGLIFHQDPLFMYVIILLKDSVCHGSYLIPTYIS